MEKKSFAEMCATYGMAEAIKLARAQDKYTALLDQLVDMEANDIERYWERKMEFPAEPEEAAKFWLREAYKRYNKELDPMPSDEEIDAILEKEIDWYVKTEAANVREWKEATHLSDAIEELEKQISSYNWDQNSKLIKLCYRALVLRLTGKEVLK